MISIRGLSHRVLRIPKLAIGEGYTSFIGPNGGGKTTLLRLCAGIELPERGDVTVNGGSPRSCEIGYVGEFPDRTLVFERVKDEIASPLRFRHCPCSVMEEQVEQVAAQLGIGELLQRRTRELSGGERVLVALAAALIVSPEILVLDEFDSHVDMETYEGALRGIADFEVPHVLHATHHMEIACQADMVIFMDEGRARYAGSPSEVFAALEGSCYQPFGWGVRA
ncbi:MAG: energy-coupling factor ABC transporter ATP-binding protein [Methanomicrobiales archaeon]|nr:energy-coupling factor ABC transporter ATP-binding protein [Methanomicrobiales archaeon]